MTNAPEEWQLAGDSAELYERHLVPSVTLPWALELVERVGVNAGDRVLDVACGTGAVARVAAERAGHGGRVVGVDVNSAMLQVAMARLPQHEWREADVLELPYADGEFDVVCCQLGLQFFSDRPGALAEMRRVLAPGGRLGVSVYSAIERNPAAVALAHSLDRHFGEGASRAKRHEHSLADRAQFAQAGFTRPHVETVIREVRFASVDEWVRIQFAATPLAVLLEGEPAERERLMEDVVADVASACPRSEESDGFAFRQEVHLAVATAGPQSSEPSEARRYDRDLLLGSKRNELLELWEIEQYGRDSFGDADWVCVYGLRPHDWHGRGVRLLGRTVAECTRDRLAASISRDVAAVAREATGGGTVVVDPFVGSGNTLLWLARALEPRVAVGFELDDVVAALSQRNVALLDLPIVLRHAPYERGIPEIQSYADDLVVVFVAPPWGDALTEGGELDLRRTTPPVAEVVDLVATTFDGRRLLVAVQLYEQVDPESLADIVDRLDWSTRRGYSIVSPGRNSGLLIGTLRWTP